jgi:hypothetical protein
MNYARIAAAAVVAWVVSLGIGFVVNMVLLADLARANTPPMRPESEIMGMLPLGFVFLLLGFFAFAYAYAKGYEGGSGLTEGIRFGVVMALIIIGFAGIWQYIVFPISESLTVAMVIDTLVESAIYGAIVGMVYRPAGVAAARRVGA